MSVVTVSPRTIQAGSDGEECDLLQGKEMKCNEIRQQAADKLTQDERRGILRPDTGERI